MNAARGKGSMKGKKAYRPVNYRWFSRLVKGSLGAWLRRVYRVEPEGLERIQGLAPPFVLVANHVTTRDPFWLSVFFRDPIYWVASDGNMRTRLMRSALRLVGTIPKSKAIPDLETVNHLVRVVRKQRGIVGLFPEGQQTWDGRTLPLFPATAKLLKLLKVPVVAARIKGGYLSLPRWTWRRRKGKVAIKFQLLFSAEEVARLPAEEVFHRLVAALDHDEFAFEATAGIPFRSSRRAENLELSLYLCPFCQSFGSLRSSGRLLHCQSCGTTQSLDSRYRLHRVGEGSLPFPDIPSWDAWQTAELARRAARAVAEEPRPLFSDSGAILLRGRRMNPLQRLRTGTLVLYPDRIELATLLGERLRFPLAELEAVGVLKRNLFEFYQGKNLYQIRFPRRSISARKWADAVLALQAAAIARRSAENP